MISDETGSSDISKEAAELEIKRKLQAARGPELNLDMTDKFTPATEYFTQEEMTAFKKPKKGGKGKRALRKKKSLKADDLLPEAMEAVVSAADADFGSRFCFG